MPWKEIRSIWFLHCLCICPCVKGHNWFSYITLSCKTNCQSSRRLPVTEISLPCGFFMHINLVIACFVQASDDRLLKMRIDHHNQQLFRLINRLITIIGTSLVIKGICSAVSQRDNIKKYGYYKCFPISCDFCTKFDCFTSKYHFFYLSSFAIGNFLHTILWTTHTQNITLFHLLTYTLQTFSSFLWFLHKCCLFYLKNIKTIYDSQGFIRFY